MKQILPSFGLVRFSCPFCGALAHQYWGQTRVKWLSKDDPPRRFDLEKLLVLFSEQKKMPEDERHGDFEKFPEYVEFSKGMVLRSIERRDPFSHEIYNVDVSKCDSCDEIAIWISDRLAHPAVGPSVLANKDMPIPVKNLFTEAGSVFSTSPRASAALLRLALQVLLKELGEQGKDINTDINSLFDKGLSPNLAKVMHSLRIVGNESVHPGVISVDDDPTIAAAMFKLINELVEQLISRPREQAELWDMLPKEKTIPVDEKLNPKEK